MRKLVNSTPEKFPLVDHGLVFPVGFTPLGLGPGSTNISYLVLAGESQIYHMNVIVIVV